MGRIRVMVVQKIAYISLAEKKEKCQHYLVLSQKQPMMLIRQTYGGTTRELPIGKSVWWLFRWDFSLPRLSAYFCILQSYRTLLMWTYIFSLSLLGVWFIKFKRQIKLKIGRGCYYAYFTRPIMSFSNTSYQLMIEDSWLELTLWFGFGIIIK